MTKTLAQINYLIGPNLLELSSKLNNQLIGEINHTAH